MLVNSYQGFAICFVCGAPGSGKSYIMTRDVMRRLRETNVRVVTNLPLNVEEIAAEVAKSKGVQPQEIADRITLISRETLQRWRHIEQLELDGKEWKVAHGPWDWDDQAALNAELILDECHIYCPKKGVGSQTFSKAWTDYLGEARHRGWHRIVFVTQDESKVGSSIVDHAELRYEITNVERLRDPFFKIPVGDWLEVIASVTREFRSVVSLVEYRRIVGKLRIQHSERVTLDPLFFRFYRSHEAAGGGTGEGAIQRRLREFEQRGALLFKRDEKGRKVAPVWYWFLARHWWRFAIASVVIAVGFWALFGGGLARAPRYLTSFIGGKAKTAVPSPALPGGEIVPVNQREQAAAVEQQGLAAAMKNVDPESRAIIEDAMRRAAAELRRKDEELMQRQAVPIEEPLPDDPLPFVSAFVGGDAAIVGGRKVKEGDSILLNEGKRRVKVRRIDRAERTVYLEDSRVLRFAVRDGGVSIPGGVPLKRVASPTPAPIPAGVQPLGEPPEGQPSEGSAGGPEKSVVVRRSNAAAGVREAPGGRVEQ